ncbi:ribosome maturation factor RimM [Anaerospora hongkongensis]|uniref:ribosome maturation factor RimM n=1 Tax=Anaerospora hongkongensis TaxID=244830 RepID=UPI0028A2AFB9|nr:ribosome maturation factor RimM [Anaerospora hongkongensis]
MADNQVIIGKIVAPHGVRGDVRVIPLTDFPERFHQLETVYTDDGAKLTVESARFHKQFVLIKFRSVQTMNDAEQLRGKLIKVRREDAVVLPEGHYYFFDIIGLAVYTESGDFLGEITDILQTGSNDVYIAEKANEKPLLIPALKEVVRQIDIPGKKIVVKLQEEWDDDSEN